jgi:aminoglycoside phosphotransferase (APT) family kinase protein
VNAAALAGHFTLAGGVRAAEPLPRGHINDSWRVTADGAQYLLQRINPHVFPSPLHVMENVARVTAHLGACLSAAGVADAGRRALRLVPARGGGQWVVGDDGDMWRCYAWVPGAHTKERADTPEDAYRAARAFGEFLRLLADYAGPPLHETIAGFHDTAARFGALATAVHADQRGRAAGARAEIDAICAHRDLAQVLPPLVAAGEVPVRIVHNDAKLANVLLDDVTGAALCVVDLDTVMPGLALHDFGDLVRSLASPTDEDEPDVSRVGVREEFFAALGRGFLEAAGAILTPRERSLLVFAGRLITLEQAARFLTDHLSGDRYYRTLHEGQNLRRARTQIRLFESLTEHAPALERIVESLP